MSQELEEHDSRKHCLGMEYDQISIRDTVLCCKVEGMQTTAKSLAKIELHLASIAQSLAIIADAKAKLEEK
jgi:hypothetical protein